MHDLRSHLQPSSGTSAAGLGSSLGLEANAARRAGVPPPPGQPDRGSKGGGKGTQPKKVKPMDKVAESKVKDVNNKVGDVRTLKAKLELATTDELRLDISFQIFTTCVVLFKNNIPQQFNMNRN